MSAKPKKITVINGPNLNLLGTRQPDIYGHTTLDEIENNCIRTGNDNGLEVVCLQSNHEGQIVTWIHQAINNADALVINAAAFTHTSIAIRDAVNAFPGYTVELHITNVYQRETFRHHSYLSPVVNAVVAGLGADGYICVIRSLANILESAKPQTTY